MLGYDRFMQPLIWPSKSQRRISREVGAFSSKIWTGSRSRSRSILIRKALYRVTLYIEPDTI